MPGPDSSTQIWILISVASALAGICAFGLKMALSLVLVRLDKIADRLEPLQVGQVAHSQKIEQLEEGWRDHEGRIRDLEKAH